MRSKLTISFYL